MRVKQIDPIHTPEKFFLPRDTGEVSIDPETLEETPVLAYDLVNEEQTVRDAVSYRRKAQDGYQDLRIYGDRTELWHNGGLVAESKVYLEYLDGEKWLRFDFGNLTYEKVVDSISATPPPDSLKAEKTVGEASLKIEALWQGGDNQSGKQTFTLAYPHQTIRCVWVVTIHNEAAIIDYADYNGNVEDNQVDNVRTIIFESKGVVDKLTVDPYLVITEPAGEIVITTSEDVITFTAATENAVLTVNTPNMAQVTEDYYLWTIYDNRMHRWRHDTAASTHGMAGADYAAIQVTGEWYWYPLTASENTGSAAITTQLQNTNDGTVNIGSPVTDLNIPDIFDADDGLASDGARHIDSASNAGKVTVTQTEVKPVIVDHNWELKSGVDTEHLVGHWKMDDNAASTVVLAETGGNGTLAGGDNTEDKANADAVRGTSLLLNGTDDYIDLSSSIANLADVDRFTIIVTLKPNFAYSGVDVTLFSFGEGWNNAIFVRYLVSKFRLYDRIGTGDVWYALSDAYADNTSFQKYRTFMLSVDITRGVAYASVNGLGSEPVFIILDGSGFTTPADEFHIGRYPAGEWSAIYVDEVKLFDECILPYGAFETQYDQRSDYDNAHADILFYWNGSDCTGSNVAIGGVQGTEGGSGGTFQASGGLGSNDDYYDTEGTAELHFSVTSEDIMDFNKGSLSMWFNIQTIGAGDALFGVGDADDYIQAVLDASGNIGVTYRSASTSETIVGDIACGTGEWHHLRVTWDDTGNVHSYIDGVENGTAQTVANTYAGAASDVLYFGADYAGSNLLDAFIDEVYITNNPNTPQIWTAFGKPLWTPLIDVSIA